MLVYLANTFQLHIIRFQYGESYYQTNITYCIELLQDLHGGTVKKNTKLSDRTLVFQAKVKTFWSPEYVAFLETSFISRHAIQYSKYTIVTGFSGHEMTDFLD